MANGNLTTEYGDLNPGPTTDERTGYAAGKNANSVDLNPASNLTLGVTGAVVSGTNGRVWEFTITPNVQASIDFGDSSYDYIGGGSVNTIRHTYTASATYTVTVNAAGCTQGSYAATVTVT